jgi:hypothetical protein
MKTMMTTTTTAPAARSSVIWSRLARMMADGLPRAVRLQNRRLTCERRHHAPARDHEDAAAGLDLF